MAQIMLAVTLHALGDWGVPTVLCDSGGYICPEKAWLNDLQERITGQKSPHVSRPSLPLHSGYSTEPCAMETSRS